ncbi:hypothetical protein BKA66DRAFT_452457 [Pyrenochaeta sp. MPI-SDFR-AT-0127]|nr:hypothetical protein BKA66DRAFT_452457 [Pyrenochaeta sp. MPI-SDFR-AT-0127]
MSDIEKSFTFLQEGIPQWLQDIARVEARVTAMQDEVTKISVSPSRYAKRQSESTKSIRPGKLGAITEEVASSNAAHTDPPGNRKRKTLSVLSGRASGPARHRPKQMVIMNYDGDMQKSFELLVRAIGTGRNMLRKAKMEAKMIELAALAGGSSEEEEENDADEEEIMSKISYRPRMSSMRARAAARRSDRLGVPISSSTPVGLFDTTDKTLETAQGLCEKAAHVTLRDGDCRKELEAVRKNFEDVLETATTEVVKCNTRKSHEAHESHLQGTSDTPLSSVEPSYKKHFPSLSITPREREERPTAILPIVPVTSAPLTPKVVGIEVDDDEEDEDISFVMPPVRLTSRLTART